jgi:GNAT superfamily N-acetyltransferase
MEALIAERQGLPVGFAHVVFHRATSTIALSCLLIDLFVDAALRGQGIGRALVEAVFARAAKAGVRRVYWHVMETNAAARQLYDKVASRSGHIVYRKDL